MRRFFSHSFFGVLSKLTYGCYVIHPVIILLVTAEQYTQDAFREAVWYVQVPGFLFWAFFGSLLLHVVVERPAAKINDYFTK
jgi:surface polysaccharide O-acyltransferase-like enzyme